jgi:formylmethanofuran--tetrahydromethanopterin N-formyltransferase
MKYKLKASTNHVYCPTLRTIVPDTVVPEGCESVLEIVINGLTLDSVKKAMSVGVQASIACPGVMKISAGNYGGKLGPFKAYLKEAIGIPQPPPVASQKAGKS